jgi:hypothetical protein
MVTIILGIYCLVLLLRPRESLEMTKGKEEEDPISRLQMEHLTDGSN